MTQTSQELEDRLISDFSAVVAVKAAFRLGLLELTDAAAIKRKDVFAGSRSGGLLKQLLRQAGVLEPDSLALTDTMREVLAQRGSALRSIIEFNALSAADCLRFPELLFGSPRRFMTAADTFDFFQYGRAGTIKAADIQATEPWVDYVSALTEREGAVIAPLMPLDGVATLLDVGGNSGAFGACLLAAWPALSVTVLDLPAVVHIGQRRYADADTSARLSFVAGDARRGPLPPVDAICFKSVLHDWSEEEARDMLSRAAAGLASGGRLIVVERGRIEDEPPTPDVGLGANLVFARFYRTPDTYAEWMRAAGLDLLVPSSASSGTTFHLVAGQKP